MILTVTLNPCVDHTLFLDSIALNDTNRVNAIERDAGGKGVNVSRVIRGLEGRTLATGFLGGGAGAYVRSALDREEVPHDFVTIADETRINFSVECGDNLPPTCFNEPGPRVSEAEVERLLDTICRHLPSARWLVAGGSRPTGVAEDIFFQIGMLAREAGVSFALDADGEMLRLGLGAGPALLKPNANEVSRLLGRRIATTQECVVAATEVAQMSSARGGNPTVVISRGAQGAVMYAEGRAWFGVSPSVEYRSTVGSGDSMVGAMLVAFSQDKSPQDCLRHGLAAGAATAAHLGSGLCRAKDVQALMPLALVHEVPARSVETLAG